MGVLCFMFGSCYAPCSCVSRIALQVGFVLGGFVFAVAGLVCSWVPWNYPLVCPCGLKLCFFSVLAWAGARIILGCRRFLFWYCSCPSSGHVSPCMSELARSSRDTLRNICEAGRGTPLYRLHSFYCGRDVLCIHVPRLTSATLSLKHLRAYCPCTSLQDLKLFGLNRDEVKSDFAIFL